MAFTILSISILKDKWYISRLGEECEQFYVTLNRVDTICCNHIIQGNTGDMKALQDLKNNFKCKYMCLTT
jgi:hypothetical protein